MKDDGKKKKKKYDKDGNRIKKKKGKKKSKDIAIQIAEKDKKLFKGNLYPRHEDNGRTILKIEKGKGKNKEIIHDEETELYQTTASDYPAIVYYELNLTLNIGDRQFIRIYDATSAPCSLFLINDTWKDIVKKIREQINEAIKPVQEKCNCEIIELKAPKKKKDGFKFTKIESSIPHIVSIGRGITLDVGDYQSVKPLVRLTVPCDIGNYGNTFSNVLKWINNRLREDLRQLTKDFGL